MKTPTPAQHSMKMVQKLYIVEKVLQDTELQLSVQITSIAPEQKL